MPGDEVYPVRNTAFLPDLGDNPDLQSAVGIEAFGFLPHRPNYLLPAAYGRGFTLPASSSKPTEIEFQVSLKLPFSLPELHGRPDAPVIFFAYTGSAWWQAYETRRSSPFREYNHAPELFLQMPIRQSLAGWQVEHVQFGFEHHSNGRASLESRSWNRLFAQMDITRESRYWAKLRTWWRLPESAKLSADASEGDDNPDITDFYGRGELRFGYRSRGLNWNVMLRRDFRGQGKGAAELNLSYPTRFNPRARWTVRLFDGYGESLIDYNRRVQRIGLGLMLSDWY